MDEQNPAVARQMQIPPAMLEEVSRNPAVLENLSRKMLLVNLDKLQRMMKRDDLTVAQRLAFAQFLADLSGTKAPKGGGANGSASISGPGFSVNIVLNSDGTVARQPTTNLPQPKPIPAGPIIDLKDE